MTNFLIVTSESDIHADVVIKKMDRSKTKPIRLNSESFIQKSQYFYEWGALGNLSQAFLSFKDSLIDVQDISVIWWRKPDDYLVFPEVQNDWAIKYCQQETKSLLHSLSGLYPQAKWINNYHKMRLPSNRINQIPIAQKLGLSIPPTIVTNSYEAAYNFIAKHGHCIIKAMRYSGFLHKGKQYACYTRPIDLETLEEFKDSIRLAPVFIQRRIHKKAEYRVTLIGKRHFVCRIDSQQTQDLDIALDWRVTEPEKIIHVPDDLPIDYLQKLYKMLNEFDLNFGAFDIICDNDDVLYFIELNPNGQWYWIEILTSMPMVDAMIELIESLALQYQQLIKPD